MSTEPFRLNGELQNERVTNPLAAERKKVVEDFKIQDWPPFRGRALLLSNNLLE